MRVSGLPKHPFGVLGKRDGVLIGAKETLDETKATQSGADYSQPLSAPLWSETTAEASTRYLLVDGVSGINVTGESCALGTELVIESRD